MDWDTTKAPGRFSELPKELQWACRKRLEVLESGVAEDGLQDWYENFIDIEDPLDDDTIELTLSGLAEMLEDDISDEGYTVDIEAMTCESQADIVCHVCGEKLGEEGGVDDGYGELVHTRCQSDYEED